MYRDVPVLPIARPGRRKRVQATLVYKIGPKIFQIYTCKDSDLDIAMLNLAFVRRSKNLGEFKIPSLYKSSKILFWSIMMLFTSANLKGDLDNSLALAQVRRIFIAFIVCFPTA